MKRGSRLFVTFCTNSLSPHTGTPRFALVSRNFVMPSRHSRRQGMLRAHLEGLKKTTSMLIPWCSRMLKIYYRGWCVH